MSNFRSNHALLQERDPLLAFIALKHQHIEIPILEKEDASWITKYLHDTTKIILIFGSCTSDMYRKVCPWLKEDDERHIIFLEDNLSHWIAFLHSRAAGQILQNSQIVQLFSHSKNYQEFIATGWKIFSQKFTIAISPYINNQEQKQKKVLEILDSMRLICAELKDFERRSLKNIYHNYLSGSECGDYMDLQDTFRGIPAIVCGAGKSLSANYDNLRNSFSKSLLVAGGRCMGLLQSMSIPVHVGVALCPYVNWRDFTCISSSTVPLLYSSRLNFEAQFWHHGLSRLIAKGTSYYIEDWLYSQYGFIFPNIDIGWDVICFSLHLVYHFGCNPIILIGVDHAGEYVSKWRDNHHIDQTYCLNVEGKIVSSQQDWIISSFWLNQFAKENPDRQYIHINDKGLSIPNMKTISCAQMDSIFAKTHRSYDIENRFHAILQKTKRQIFVYNNSVKILYQLRESMQQLSVHCQNHLDAFEKQNDREQFLEQMEIESEISFSLLFEPLWEIYKVIIFSIGINYSIKEIMLHRTLFIQRTLRIHISCIEEVLCYGNITN